MTEQGARYGTVSIVFHWVIALAIVFMIILGWRLEEAEGPARYALYQLHKSLGITILLLSLGRLAWRLTHRPPPEEPMPAWQKRLALAVHVAFYVIMIGIPLTGWAMVSASPIGVPTMLWGAIPWPDLPLPRSEGLAETFSFGHGALVKLTYGLLLLHVAGALKHHFVDKDRTLGRMVPGVAPGKVGARVIAVAAALGLTVAAGYAVFAGEGAAAPAPKAPAVLTAPPAEATAPVEPVPAETPAPTQPSPDLAAAAAPVTEALKREVEPSRWVVDPADSALRFETRWGDQAIRGRFSTFDADIRFDPENLAKSRVRVGVELASVSTGDAERDGQLPGPDWFAASENPRAIFDAEDFRRTGENRYTARGRLNLRGVSRPVTLRFTLRIDGDTARATGTTTLDRTAFGVGQGQWASTDQIPAEVKVDFQILARRQR